MSVQHMNPDDGLPNVEWDKEVKSIHVDKATGEFKTLRSLLIVDEALGVDDGNLYEQAKKWADKVIEITNPSQFFTYAYANPEFPPEAYSVENLLRISKDMNDKMLEVDNQFREGIRSYLKGDADRIMEFCKGCNLTILEFVNLLTTNDRIPALVYDKVRGYISSKEKPQ